MTLRPWWIGLCLCGIACDAADEPSLTITPGPPALGRAALTVATYNLYLGADLAPLLAGGLQPASAGAVVAGTFLAVAATDPPARMDAIAGELAALAPDLVAVQEVALWRTQAPADGAATPATVVAYDFLPLLLHGLERRGLTYTVLVEALQTDVEVTGDFAGAAMDVRLTDRDVILVNGAAGLSVVGTEVGRFRAALVVPTPALDTITVSRGWALAELAVAGRNIRVVNTHLEALAPPVREAQATELALGPAASNDVVLLGDFNFVPGSRPYQAFAQAGLVDQWLRAGAVEPGPTCCQAGDLRNPVSTLDQRIDLVFTRGVFLASSARRLDADEADRAAAGLWPSDHAGVYLRLDLGEAPPTMIPAVPAP